MTREAYRDTVTALWAEGLTQKEIGERLGKTRNAIAGMIRSFGLPKRTEGQTRGWAAKRVADAKPKQPPAPDPIGPHNDFPPRGTCQHTADNPGDGDWRMCGHTGFPWCDYHHQRLTIPRKTGDTI